MIKNIKKLYFFWRYYTLGREQYYESMKKNFSVNLHSLRQGNILTSILTG